jgi:HK97 family phage prohead protease
MLQLQRKEVPVEVKIDEAKRRVEGYAAVFNNVDNVDDRIHRGAFADTIKDRLGRGLIKCMRNHRVLIGKPVHLEEDQHGLLTVNQLSETDGEFGGKSTLILLKDGALTHMSILYRPQDYDYEVIEGEREIRNLRKIELHEQGYVDFPANEMAAVTGVPKSLPDLAMLLGVFPKDLARALRAERYTTAERDLITRAADQLGGLATELKALLAPAEQLEPEGLHRLQRAFDARRALATT